MNLVIAELVYFLQRDYVPELLMTTCRENVQQVLSKREIQYAVLTGIQMDMLCEKKQFCPSLQPVIEKDEGLYGIDEVIALSIVNVYGSIGLTNFGYIDKLKPGILAKLNDKNSPNCHTFLDDIIGAVAAAASSRLAHSVEDEA